MADEISSNDLVKGFEGSLEHIRHDYDGFTFIPSGDYLVVEGTSQGRMSGKSWKQAAKLLAGVSATSSSFAMAEYRACISISIPTIRVRMRRDFDGVRIVSGDEDTSQVLQHIHLADPQSSRRLRWKRSRASARGHRDLHRRQCVLRAQGRLPWPRRDEPEELGKGGRIQWVSSRPGEAPAYAGTGFIIARDGRIAAVYLFFDKLPWAGLCRATSCA